MNVSNAADVSGSIRERIMTRYSCRRFDQRLINEAERESLLERMRLACRVPFGSAVRLELLAASEEDSRALRGLGTYGFIQGAPAFLAGAVGPGEHNLEDFGWAVEDVVLHAAGMNLGTCWLGGSFNKSGFARKIGLERGEELPAVVAIGHVEDPERERRALPRRKVGALQRLAWDALFYERQFGRPLTEEGAGAYAQALEMVRWAPSASNKQPWRILRDGRAWHFYLRRTPGYPGGMVKRLLQISDLQRVDMGIAMFHFARTAEECGLNGSWTLDDPGLVPEDEMTAYCATWIEKEIRPPDAVLR